MPHGFPAATVTICFTIAHDVETLAPVGLDKGTQVEIFGRGAEQDGARWDEVLCALENSRRVLIQRHALRLD